MTNKIAHSRSKVEAAPGMKKDLHAKRRTANKDGRFLQLKNYLLEQHPEL